MIVFKKYHDYGTWNLLRQGEIGILECKFDRNARIENIVEMERSGKNMRVKDETKEVTYLDIIGYCLQAVLM